MKDIIISEGRTSKQFLGVKRIHTNLLDGSGTCSWIPEEEADDYANIMIKKEINENGTYSAAVDGYAGYSSVVVNVENIIDVPTGEGGVSESMFMDSLETNVINFVCTPNLNLTIENVETEDNEDGEKEEKKVITWRDGYTHTFTCANTSELRGLWVINETDLVFKEQHLVTAVDYTNLTSMHIVEFTINGRQLYFSEIIDGANPYRDYTLTPPEERITDITPEVAEMYKVYIRKTEEEYEKFKFAAIENEGTYSVRLLLGTGKDLITESGKAIIEKDTDGLAVSYVSRKDDIQRGIYINDYNTYLLKDSKKLPILAGEFVNKLPEQYDEDIIYFTLEENGGT